MPLLDGVVERALKLIDEWREKKPELDAAPSYLLFFNALTCADLVRTIDAFQKAGLQEDLALRFAHSHLPEVLMYAGVTSLLGINTWWLDNKINTLCDPPNSFGLTRDDATGKERFKQRMPWAELRSGAEFKVELMGLVGPEATELLFQACQAYDKWVRGLEQKPAPESGELRKPSEAIESVKKLEFKTEQKLKPEPELEPEITLVQCPPLNIIAPPNSVLETKPIQDPLAEIVPPPKPHPEQQNLAPDQTTDQYIKLEIEKIPEVNRTQNSTQIQGSDSILDKNEKPSIPADVVKEPESVSPKFLHSESTDKQKTSTQTEDAKKMPE